MTDSNCFFFFFNDTATTEIYTLSLHDALPISGGSGDDVLQAGPGADVVVGGGGDDFLESGYGERDADRMSGGDRKSTRLNSSHANISYAVFCLKKKKKNKLWIRLH